MLLRHKIVGLVGLMLALLLAPDAQAFHHHWFFHHHAHQAGASSQGAFPWQIIPPLLQAGQQILSSSNLLPTQPSPNIVNSDVKSAVDKTGEQMKALTDRLKDLPPLNQPVPKVTRNDDGSHTIHIPKSPSTSRVPPPPGSSGSN